jgi:ABC-type branched-subunit amino acid transport system substrate-binding protein
MSTNPQGRHRSRALAGTALVVVALIVLAACSSSKKSSSTATTAAASATTAAGSATTAATAPATPKTITVTLIGPFTGPFASSSTALQKTMQYVFDQVNAGTGVIKAPGYTFKLVTNDDGNVASKALDFARTALSNGSHILNLVGHAEVDAVQPLTSTGQLLGTQEDPPDVDRNATTYPYSFDFYANDIDGITAQMRLASSKGVKKFAVLAGAGDQYQGYVDDVTKALPTDAGASIVLTQRFDPNTSDFSSIVTKVVQSGADGVWFFATGSPVQSFFQAMQAANSSLPIFNAFGSLTCAACFALPPAFLSHVYVAFPKSSLLGSDGNPLVAAYGQETQNLWTHFNLTSPTDKAGLGAGLEDIPYGIVWGVVQAGGDDPAKLKAAYEGTTASGGVSFLDPSIKYEWSSTDHGGYETANVAAAVFGFNIKWPGFFAAAS